MSNFFWVQKHAFGLTNKISKNDLIVFIICLCSFITVVQRTVVRRRYLNSFTHCFSTGYVGELSLSFKSISNSPDKFRYVRLVNFFLKSVLPVILKEIQSFFFTFTFRLLHKLWHAIQNKTKNVLQFTLRRRTVDSAKDNSKARFVYVRTDDSTHQLGTDDWLNRSQIEMFSVLIIL